MNIRGLSNQVFVRRENPVSVGESKNPAPVSFQGIFISKQNLEKLMLMPDSPQVSKLESFDIVRMIKKNMKKLAREDKPAMVDILYPVAFLRKMATKGNKGASKLLNKLEKNSKYGEKINDAARDTGRIYGKIAQDNAERAARIEKELKELREKYNYFA